MRWFFFFGVHPESDIIIPPFQGFRSETIPVPIHYNHFTTSWFNKSLNC